MIVEVSETKYVLLCQSKFTLACTTHSNDPTIGLRSELEAGQSILSTTKSWKYSDDLSSVEECCHPGGWSSGNSGNMGSLLAPEPHSELLGCQLGANQVPLMHV